MAKSKQITVGDVKVRVPNPDRFQLSDFVATEDDLRHLAKRAWEQALRSYLLRLRKGGASVAQLERLAKKYEYHRNVRG